MRFGLIGTGHWASTVHATELAAHADVELVGVFGRDPRKAETVAHVHGVTAYADLEALLEDVDAVSVAVPPHIQAPLAEQAARAGKHLLLEKPIATDLAAADALVDAAADVATVVFFSQRFVPAHEAWLTEQAARPLLGARYEWWASVLAGDSPYADSQWRKDRGALWDIGPHVLSVLLPLLGPVEHVVGARGPGDATHLVLTHAGGATSTVSVSLTTPEPAARRSLEVYDAEGWSVRPEISHVGAFAHAITALIDSASSGVPASCDVAFGRDVVALLERCEAQLGDRRNA